MKRMRSILAISGLLGVILSAMPAGVAAAQNCRFEGTWVGSYVTADGARQYTMTLVPNVPGNEFQILLAAVDQGATVGGLFPGARLADADVRGEGVRVAPRAAEFRLLAHGVVDGLMNPEIVYLRVDDGSASFADSCDRLDIVSDIKIYLPGADADDDGIPDPGATPIVQLTLPSVAKRFGMSQ